MKQPHHSWGEPAERCIACGGILLYGVDVFDDVNGGVIHASCCGPERECYVDLESGAPIKAGEPIPTPYKWGVE